jgi:hypothetical protein
VVVAVRASIDDPLLKLADSRTGLDDDIPFG